MEYRIEELKYIEVETLYEINIVCSAVNYFLYYFVDNHCPYSRFHGTESD